MMRTLVSKTHALIFDANLKSTFWGEATLMAAYLSNRSPSITVPKLPVQMWTGLKPYLANLKIFGTTVHACVTTYLKKLDSRSNTDAFFIGCAPHGYKLYDP